MPRLFALDKSFPQPIVSRARQCSQLQSRSRLVRTPAAHARRVRRSREPTPARRETVGSCEPERPSGELTATAPVVRFAPS